MKSRFAIALATLLMIGIASAALPAQDLVENPQYLSWKAHRLSSSVSYEIKSSTGGRTSTMFMTQRLVSVDAECATIEVVGAMKMFGITHKAPPEREQVAAKISPEQAARGVLSIDATGIVTSLANETLTVAGEVFDCAVVEFSGSTSSGKAWTNPRVPGTVIKTEFRNTSAGGSVMTMTLKSVKLVK